MSRNNQVLKKTGTKISATIDCVKVSRTRTALVMPSGAAGLGSKIHCIYKDPQTNQTSEYETDYLLFPYTDIPYINLLEKPTIDVYIDKNNPKNYYIDISKIKLISINDPEIKGQIHGYGLFITYDGKTFSMVKDYDA